MFIFKMREFWSALAGIIVVILGSMNLVSESEQGEVTNILGGCLNAVCAAFISVMSVMAYAKKHKEKRCELKAEKVCENKEK